MSLIGDGSPSCSVCGGDCAGFVNKTKPISLPGRDVVQRAHPEATETEGKDAEAEAQGTNEETRIIARRSQHPSANRAQRLAQDRAMHPEGDR